MPKDSHESQYLDMDAADNKMNHMKEDNNNTDKRASSKYEDMTGSQGFDSLIPPEASYANANDASRVVELDDDGNELGELPRVTRRLPSRYIRMPSKDPEDLESGGSLVPSPGPEEEQICLSPGVDDLDGGYLEPHGNGNHLYEEIKEVKRTVEVTPTGSRIVTFEERTRRIPRSIRRLHSKISGKPMPDEDYIKCSCNKKMLWIAMIVVLLIVILTSVILVVTLVIDKKEPDTGRVAASKGSKRDVIFPTLTCPPSTTVTLTTHKQTLKLSGADARDNIGIASLEYVPVISDNSAEYKIPDTLVVSRSSVGRNYSVLVKTRDVDDNEAQCKFYVAVKEDPCVPWKMPKSSFSTRKVVETSDGWSATYECRGHSSGTDQQRAPHPLSYHYLDDTVTFTCTTGTDFTPNKLFSCQEPEPALYSYVTSLDYQYLDYDGSKLQNITVEKATSCFEEYYRGRLVAIQETLSERLQENIIQKATAFSLDLSDMELIPSTKDYPSILDYDEITGRVQTMNIGLAYQVGPAGEAFPSTALNVLVKGNLRTAHNTLFDEGMLPFSRLRGNIAVGCPDIQAPSTVSIFNEISSGFSCNEGQKEHEFYDDHLKTQLTVCLGCPVGEFYNKESKSCEECMLNTYQDIVGALECKLCPLNKRTEKTGARSIQECVPIS